MKLEKLRYRSRKKVILGLTIGLTITSSLILSISLAKFKKTESIPLAKGTINYSESDFSMVAIKISEDKENYIDSDVVPTSGYTLNTDRSTCKVRGIKEDIEITYTEGKIYFGGMTKKNTKCNLYFDKYWGPPISISEIITNLNATTQTDSVPNFASAATTNEGVFKTSDGMYGGDTYYWRGAVDNNHVIFADMCWKIIRINGDGSIRMIYNGTPENGVCKQVSDETSIAVANQGYNPSDDKSYYAGWTYEVGKQRPSNNSIATASNIKIQTDNWYKVNIIDAGFDKQVALGKFCNDRNLSSGSSWAEAPTNTFYYAAHQRIETNKKPVTTCPESDVYEIKAGAITADEVSMAGGKRGSETNKLYYLYNNSNYWTMTPCTWRDDSLIWAFRVLSGGQIGNAYMTITNGVRPVINLKSDTVFKSGTNGTSSTPYVVI